MRRLVFRPRLEELEGKLPPSSLHGALADLGQPNANNAHRAGQLPSPLLPTQSHAFGRSFEEWNVLYSRWAIEDNLGVGSTLNQTTKHVAFLPTVTTPGVKEFNVTLAPGTPFVAPTFFVFAERYDDPNVRDDIPQDIVDFRLFETATVKLQLDGRTLLDGKASDLVNQMYGPTYFDQPIVYAQPQPRGENLNATAALFIQGVGTLNHPLPVGEHTLVSTVHSDFFGDFLYTYHITVSPR